MRDVLLVFGIKSYAHEQPSLQAYVGIGCLCDVGKSSRGWERKRRKSATHRYGTRARGDNIAPCEAENSADFWCFL